MDDLIQFNSPTPIFPSTSKTFPHNNDADFMPMERESLGVLPDDFFANKSFLNMTDTGRESFDLLNCSFFGRPSLSAFNDNSFLGRESLGILNLKAIIEANSKNTVPDILLTIDAESCNSDALYPKPKLNALVSTSSFNSNSLEGPSKIYSVSSTSKDVFNEAICNTNDFREKLKLNNETYLNISNTFDSNEVKTPLEYEYNNDNFMDFVCIEAKHMASKIADGSLYEEDDVFMLDSTAPPEFCELSDLKTDDEQLKKDAETVFKTVDKLLPTTTTNNFEIKINHRTKPSVPCPIVPVDNLSTISGVSGNSNDTKSSQNFPSILHESKKSNTSSNKSNAKEILQNLSEILNNSRRSDIQKSEGQQMLDNLANLLCDNSIQSLSDSGHSSITNDEPVVEKVLDGQSNSCSSEVSVNKSENNLKSLNLSLKHKKTENKRTSQSFCAPSSSKITPKVNKNVSSDAGKNTSRKSLNNTANSKNSSQNSIVNSSRSSIAGKSKSNDVKRGPMKAVLPIKDMSKRSSEGGKTPKNNSLKPTIPMLFKRTSTPIHVSFY